MIWTALVPMKLGAERKSRLAARLDAAERRALSDAMATHVLAELARVPKLRAIVLSPTRPPSWSGDWIADQNRGLNAELEAARDALGAPPLMVVFADLPLLTAPDVAALRNAAEEADIAIAPDRALSGTNAVAVAHALNFRFAFGADSFARHRAGAPGAAIVERQGLAHDVDTPEDLDAARAAGYRFED